MLQPLVKYTNNNLSITIYPDGTKIREVLNTEPPKSIFPESIDIKITNHCDMGCAYCHESSTEAGNHGDLQKLLETLEGLPCGVELALGGGNPLDHPDLLEFLQECKNRKYIPNLTVNQGHIKKHIEKLNYLTENKLIYGLGVSITNLNFAYINKLSTPNLVYHLIAGVNTLEQLKTLKAQSSHKAVKVLLLGYKVFGFGIKHFDENTLQNINNWKKNIREVFHICDIISFDNLALEQLNIKKVLTKEAWETFYMGDDGEYTMYIDAVKQEFARSSTSFKRQSFLETTLFSFFQKL